MTDQYPTGTAAEGATITLTTEPYPQDPGTGGGTTGDETGTDTPSIGDGVNRFSY